MNYNSELWNKYTDENKNSIQGKISDFINYICIGLGAVKICEVGCNVGNNLSSFNKSVNVTGIDLNESALKNASVNYPNFKFKKASAIDIPFPDNSFDLVFTRGVLIHINPDDLKKAISELYRISKKWIFNLEYFGEDEKMIEWKRGNDLLWYRNMKKHWSEYDVDVISDCEISTDIDPGKTHFTLVRKR